MERIEKSGAKAAERGNTRLSREIERKRKKGATNYEKTGV